MHICRSPSIPSLTMRSYRYGSMPMHGGAPHQGHPGSAPPTHTKTMTVDQVVNEVSSMGFAPYQVKDVIRDMINDGQNIDLNVVIDRLTNGTK